MVGKFTAVGTNRRLPYTLSDEWLDRLRRGAVIWLLLVGLWSGPSPGATLAYPNGVLFVEVLLAVLLYLSFVRGRKLRLASYPYLWPCLTILGVSLVAALLRTTALGLPFDLIRLWKTGEPMVRGALLFLAIAGDLRAVRAAYWSILAGMAALAAATIIQHATGVMRWYADPDGGWSSGIRAVPGLRAQGLTSYINLTGAMLAAAVPYWLFMPAMHIPQRFWPRLLLTGGGAATLLALWYTNTRGAMLAVLATLLPVSLGIGWVLRRGRRRAALVIGLALAISVGMLMVNAAVLHTPLATRVTEGDIRHNPRLELYRMAMEAINFAPWTGVSDNEVAKMFRDLDHQGLRVLPATQCNVHNQFLQWAAAEGLPLAIAFSLLVFWVVVQTWRAALNTQPAFIAAFVWATAAALTIFVLSNVTEAHFWRIEGAGFFWSLAAVGAAAAQTR